MKVRDFKDKWGLTSQEMEIATEVAKSSIDHYVTKRKSPSSLELALDNLDLIWETKRLIDSKLAPQLQELYQIVVKRLDNP